MRDAPPSKLHRRLRRADGAVYRVVHTWASLSPHRLPKPSLMTALRGMDHASGVHAALANCLPHSALLTTVYAGASPRRHPRTCVSSFALAAGNRALLCGSWHLRPANWTDVGASHVKYVFSPRPIFVHSPPPLTPGPHPTSISTSRSHQGHASRGWSHEALSRERWGVPGGQ